MDRLTLRIENRSDAAGDMPEDISVLGRGISIGRKADNDWSLPDNTRFISGRHIAITYEDGAYVLEDVSTNGTFINGNAKRLDGKHTLADGDMIRIGSYIVAVEVAAVAQPAAPQIKGAQGVQAPPMAGTMRAPATGIQRHSSTTSTSARSAQTPDFSRFQTGGSGAAGVQRPTGSISRPPVMAPKPAPTVIPDDFDDDLLGPAPSGTPEETAEAPAPSPTPAPQPDAAPRVTPPKPDEIPASAIKPVVDLTPEEVSAPPVPSEVQPTPAKADTPEDDNPFATPVAEPDPTPVPAPAAQTAETPPPPRGTDGPFSLSDPTAAPVVLPERSTDPAARSAAVVEKTDMTPRGLGERFAETTPPRAQQPPPPAEAVPTPPPAAPTPAPEQAPPAPPATNELLEGFLEGAGVDDPDALAIPLRELGEMLGRCARLGTQEMMQMLQDRSAVKLFVAQEDRTMRIASGNNPMKFMIDPDEAFTALFVKPRDGYQTGPDGFDNALTDIRQHQQAMMAAIQPALADMLEGLAPADISADVGGGGGVLGSGARKSWEEYTKRWESRAAQGENGMLDAFLDAFARRYNQALDSL